MTELKNNKLKDLTPLSVNFIPGESPTADKLKGMMSQIETSLAYLENLIGDAYGEDGHFNTWLSSLARDIGNRNELNPLITPRQFIEEYKQHLVAGRVEHELDLLPTGDGTQIILASMDDSIVLGQRKDSVNELLIPGDWCIPSGYIANGEHRRKKVLYTHTPSSGGYVIFKKMTTGHGSSTQESSDNVIPTVAQAKDGGPFSSVEILDSLTNMYVVTLPKKMKMEDMQGQTIDYSASQLTGMVGTDLLTYELPPVFFDPDGLDLLTDADGGGSKDIPVGLIELYDWETRKRVEGVISIKTSPVAESRRIQFIIQFKPDVRLNILSGKYMVVVPGNTITQQLKALSSAIYSNARDGLDLMKMISHKSLLDLRTTSNSQNRSNYYGPSNIHNNDHSMYLHRNGFDINDKGAGANVFRGDLVIGNTTLGDDDNIPEHFNTLGDSKKIYFGDTIKGAKIGYIKSVSHEIEHIKGNLPKVWTDNALVIEGSVSDINPLMKNIVLLGDVRTTGNVVLGSSKTDTVFIQGRLYVNDELTLIPIAKELVTGEEGKMIYDPNEKALVYHNGVSFISPWKTNGVSVVIGDGAQSFGKYNGTNNAPFVSAIAELNGQPGIIKVLNGSYNLQYNELNIPSNVQIIGSGINTIINASGDAVVLNDNSSIENLQIISTGFAIKMIGTNSFADNLKIQSGKAAFSIAGGNNRIGQNVLVLSAKKIVSSTVSNTSSDMLKSTVGMLLPYSSGSLDWTNKAELIKEFSVDSGMTLAFNVSAASGFGPAGLLEITGSGRLYTDKMLAISPGQGVGAQVMIRSSTGAATVNIGMDCFDQNGNLLESKWFIAAAAALTTANIEQTFTSAVISLTSGLHAKARFIRPCILLISNTGIVQVDNFNFWQLGYARAATWN